MGYYEHKTKEELLEIVEKLEEKVERLSSELDSLRKGRFRERYSTRILDALPDMLTVFDHNANIVELASSPTTNHVEGTTADSIINSNVKDIVPEEAYESVRQNMDKVIRTGKSSIAEHSLTLDGVLHHYENRIFPLDDQYLLCMCRDVSQETEMARTNEVQRSEIVRLNSLMNDILNNIPVYLFVKDTGNDFRYLYWNKAFAEYSGISVERAVGRTDAEIFPDKKDAERLRQDDLKAMELGRIEYLETYTTMSGEVRTVTTMKTVVPSGGRSKEIAIRKVNGAEAGDVLQLLSRDIFWTALPAVLLGAAVAWFVGGKWLEQFSDAIVPSVWLYLSIALVVLLLIVVSVMLRAWKVANENPVNSIKSE